MKVCIGCQDDGAVPFAASRVRPDPRLCQRVCFRNTTNVPEAVWEYLCPEVQKAIAYRYHICRQALVFFMLKLESAGVPWGEAKIQMQNLLETNRDVTTMRVLNRGARQEVARHGGATD